MPHADGLVLMRSAGSAVLAGAAVIITALAAGFAN
jgi:hypothetical protein